MSMLFIFLDNNKLTATDNKKVATMLTAIDTTETSAIISVDSDIVDNKNLRSTYPNGNPTIIPMTVNHTFCISNKERICFEKKPNTFNVANSLIRSVNDKAPKL